ncbi:MAG: hypothetical protein HC910_00245 [Spirulinaceae cyanobacterium SM2_1_0]|nr:hypothetical protein [Spirulinaceae cyanobacterium SM2_1_0]
MICSLGFSNGWAVSRLGAQQHPLDVLGQAIAILDTTGAHCGATTTGFTANGPDDAIALS